MAQNKYTEIKAKRFFYILSYRMVLNTLLFSVVCNLIFLGMATYLFFNRGGQAYYATNGITNPEQLKPMNSPNYTSKPLLADDIPGDNEPTMNRLN